ncbi:hypothetical protein B0H17DRAFT_1197109 [Mycena rosella]|uniref:Uncharacterized protein n=1 Tax=Mycena rosella TaxID=1033263 RepID=A0AAD7DSQ6_MYCRO|nr:hypothetical protein B0H17DRAFT_1197109 [Mycena rosella]
MATSFLPTNRFGNKCPMCDDTLIPCLATGGQVPHTYYIRCASSHHPQKDYFFRFGKDASPPSSAPSANPVPSAASAPAPSTASIAVPSTASTNTTCARRSCRSTRLDKGCVRNMCRRHCVEEGPCAVPRHENHRCSILQQETSASTPSPPLVLPPLARRRRRCPAPTLIDQTPAASYAVFHAPALLPTPTPDFNWAPSFNTLLADSYAASMRPHDALDAYQARDALQRAEQERQLDVNIGLRSPSLELLLEEEIQLLGVVAECEEQEYLERERREEQELQLTIQLSQEAYCQPPAQPSQDDIGQPPARRPPSPAPCASTSTLPPLSASPHFPTVLLSPVVGRAVSPDMSHRPCMRLTAPSLEATKRKPVPFKITTQLNETWMGLHGGNTSSTLSTSSTPSTTLSSVFHVKRTGSWRAFVDPKLTERFMLIFLVPGAAAKILCVDNVPAFPQYTLSADARTLETLSKTVGPLGSELDVFLEKQRLWLGINIGFIHVMSTDSVLLLRRRDVPGQDEDLVISRFMMTSNTPPHLHLNLPRERAAVGEAIKTKVIINVSDSDSDSEEVEVTHEKHRRDVTASPPRCQRPRLAVVTTLEPRSMGNDDLLTVDLPSPSALSLFSTSMLTPSSSVHTSPSPSPASPTVALPSRAQLPWPQELYVVNVIASMLKMDSEDVTGTRAERFAQVFSAEVMYKPSTYNDQVRKWRNASAGLRKSALDARCTTQGLWSVFLRNTAKEAQESKQKARDAVHESHSR